MTPIELEYGQEAINNEIKKIYHQGKFENGYILDGVADTEGYLNSYPKIAWILKEAWDEEKGGEWDLVKEVIVRQNRATISKTPSLRKAAYTSSAIHSDSLWDDIPWITEDDSIANALKKTAWINISKIAGKSKSDSYNLSKAFPHWKGIIQKQLDLYSPDIIILGNTYHFVKEILHIDNVEPNYKEGSAWGYNDSNRRLIIWAYHPAARIKDSDYVDDIVDLIRKYSDNFNPSF